MIWGKSYELGYFIEEMGTAVLSRFVDTIPECTVAVVGGGPEAARNYLIWVIPH